MRNSSNSSAARKHQSRHSCVSTRHCRRRQPGFILHITKFRSLQYPPKFSKREIFSLKEAVFYLFCIQFNKQNQYSIKIWSKANCEVIHLKPINLIYPNQTCAALTLHQSFVWHGNIALDPSIFIKTNSFDKIMFHSLNLLFQHL